MNQVSNVMVFLAMHWFLVSLAIVLVGLIAVYESRRAGEGGMKPQALVTLMNDDKVAVLDVRGRDLYKKGHILNAKHFPHSTLQQQIKQLDKFKDRMIVLVDADGVQIKKSLLVLKKASIDEVKFLTGGMRAWREASLPVHKE